MPMKIGYVFQNFNGLPFNFWQMAPANGKIAAHNRVVKIIRYSVH